MTSTVCTMTIENGLIAVYSALVLKTRSDGSSYRAVSDLHPDADIIRTIVRELHDGELPNNWRYETIHSLATCLAEQGSGKEESWSVDDFSEWVPVFAASLSDDFNVDLLEWAKIGSRIEFDDVLNGITAVSISNLLSLRQEEEIESMGYRLLRLVEHYLT